MRLQIATVGKAEWNVWTSAAKEARAALCRSCKRTQRHAGCVRVAKLARSFDAKARDAHELLLLQVENAQERATETTGEESEWWEDYAAAVKKASEGGSETLKGCAP